MADIRTAVRLYRELQDRIDIIQNEADAKIKELKAKQQTLEAWIASKSLEEGVDSYKTEHGTCYFTMTPYSSVADWDATLEWVKANNRWEMLTKGVAKKSVTEFLEATGQVPPGVNYGTKRTMHIRKPTV